jgi:hypothetical protein
VNEIVKFVNEYSQLVLEVEGEATTEGTRVEQYTDTGKDHQRWRLKPAGSDNEDFYNIENAHSAMSLEVVNYSKNSGEEIVQRPYGDGPLHRQWKLVPVPGKTNVYKIENRNSGLVLDDVGGQTDAPAPVKQYGSWDDDGRQQWQLIPVPAPAPATSAPATPAPVTPAPTTPAPTTPGTVAPGTATPIPGSLSQIPTGFIKVTAKVSGKVLDVTAGADMMKDGATIRQWDWVGAVNQQFSFEPIGDGYYRIVAKVSGKVLDVTAGADMMKNGATIRQWDWVNAENQKWKLG